MPTVFWFFPETEILTPSVSEHFRLQNRLSLDNLNKLEFEKVQTLIESVCLWSSL